MRKRIFNAVVVLAVNIITWVVIPYYLGTLLAGVEPNTPLVIPSFVYVYGIVITALVVAATLTEGHPVWVPLTMASSLVVAYYLWAVTSGGILSIVQGSTQVTIDFRLILYFILAPIVWPAVRAPVSYYLYRRAASAPAVEPTLP